MVSLIAMDVTPAPKAKKHIQERVNAGKCLCCNNDSLKRGLCHQCYYKWRRVRALIGTKTKQVEYDAKLIRMGRLLAAQDVRNYKSDRATVFESTAKSLEG